MERARCTMQRAARRKDNVDLAWEVCSCGSYALEHTLSQHAWLHRIKVHERCGKDTHRVSVGRKTLRPVLGNRRGQSAATYHEMDTARGTWVAERMHWLHKPERVLLGVLQRRSRCTWVSPYSTDTAHRRKDHSRVERPRRRRRSCRTSKRCDSQGSRRMSRTGGSSR